MNEREQSEKKSFLDRLNDQLDPANQGSWGEEPDSLPSYHDMIESPEVRDNETWLRVLLNRALSKASKKYSR